MKFIRNNKFIFFNLLALIFIKAVFSYSGVQFANLLETVPVFNKEDVVSQTNSLRASSHLDQLKENPVLDQAAAKKLQDMISHQYFAHTSPSGITPWYWIDTTGYKYTYAGENLALGFSTAQDTVNAWDNSPLHRENLLNPNYQDIGVAVAPAKIDGNSGFLVVQVFGTPAPSPAQTTVIKTMKPTPTPAKVLSTKSPTPKPQSTAVTPAPTVKSAETPNTAEKTLVAASVPTPETKIDKTSTVLNLGFMVYAMVIFLISILFVIFYGLKRNLIIRTATTLALVVLTLIIPVLHLSHTALII